MEPFISSNGTYLFFNNLNDGIDTKLYYATKINDSTFNYVGELNGTNQVVSPYLDAVADMDTLDNFYWTSTRDYPAELDNLFHGIFNAGNVTNTGRVHGNFNKNIPGWLIMDHGISYDGQLLYYNNARFDDSACQGPCETELGVAEKINDSTFNQLPNSNSILQTINDPNYIYYAPCISSDNLELYYTRYLRDTITSSTIFEICVAVRNSPIDIFSVPIVLFSDFIANLIEAPTLTADKQIIYYHRKIINSHKIVLRYRDNLSNVEDDIISNKSFSIYPNPATDKIIIQTKSGVGKYSYCVLNILGDTVKKEEGIILKKHEIDISDLSCGVYMIQLMSNDHESKTVKFIKK